MGPCVLTKNCLLSVCVFVQNPGLRAVWGLHHPSGVAAPVRVPQDRLTPSGPLEDIWYWKDTGHVKWGAHVPSQGPVRAFPSDTREVHSVCHECTVFQPLEGPAVLHLAGPLASG